MSIDPSLITVEPGLCWWCRAAADSREHKMKRSDLVREYGRPPYHGERTLIRFSEGSRHEVHGPGSSLFRFSQVLCARCNNTRSQPFDRAWDALTAYLVDLEESIVRTRRIDLENVFGADWAAQSAHVARYIVKHIICRIVDSLPGPHHIDEELIRFLDGGAFPDGLQLDARLDLGVVEMLKRTRQAPAADPRAAEAGFLLLKPIWVELNEDETWHTPQSGRYYRWLALYWRVGGGGPLNTFERRVIELSPTDEAFGPDFRDVLNLTDELPRTVLDNLPEGVPAHEAVREAGYPDVADRMEAFAQRLQGRSTTTQPGEVRTSIGPPTTAARRRRPS